MAFEKAKVLKAAEKFLSQGKISAAIKEYRQLVDHDQDDLTALNMLGDLCVRAGKTEEAIGCFQRIAEYYSDEQFTLKAIAMYKKIERLKPRDPYIAHKLANLYSTQGLVVDARAQYLIVADAYSRAGQSKKALDIFHRIADLDPQNVEIRLKLAEGYVKEGMMADAAEAFIDVGKHFYNRGAFEKSLDSYSKALKLTPGKNSVLSGVLAAHVAMGTADEAAEILERAVEERPDDRQLIAMLVDACLEAEDAKGAERATAKLLVQNPSEYPHLIAVARLYLKLGEINETTRVLTGIVEEMLAGREEKELLEIVNEVLVHNPEQVGALRLLVRIHWWQRDMEALRAALERLSETAEAAELVEDERYALTQLVRIAPDEQTFLERLKQIGGIHEDEEDALIPRGAFTEVPQFETFSPSNNAITAETQDQQDQFEWEVVAAEGHHDPNSSFAELSEAFDHSAVTFESEIDAQVNREARSDVAANKKDEATPAGGADESKLMATMRQELESVDFYLAQGYSDIAADTLEMLERQFGSHPEIDSRRNVLLGNSASAAAKEAEVFEFGGADELLAANEAVATKIGPEAGSSIGSISEIDANASVPASAITTVSAAGGIDEGLAEIFEEFRVAAEEEHPVVAGDYETHYNMGTAYKEMDLLDDAIHEFQTAAGLVKPDDDTSRFLQCCNMLGHCFVEKDMPRAAVMWFQKGLDAHGHSEDEQKALRYELASVFELMGEISRAHDLFTEVYGADVGYREVGEKLRKLGAEKQQIRKQEEIVKRK